MRRIELLTSRELEDKFNELAKDQAPFMSGLAAWKHAFNSAIAYANEQLSKSEDEEVAATDDELFGEYQRIKDTLKDWYHAFKTGYKFRLKKEPEKPWQPEVGQKCAFWLNDWTKCDFDTFNALHGDFYISEGPTFLYTHCAALETLDEIGKAPSYFIERGRCIVRK